MNVYRGYVTKFALHEVLKIIGWGNLTFDERVVPHRVDRMRAREGVDGLVARILFFTLTCTGVPGS